MISSIASSSFIHHHCAMSWKVPRAGDSKTSMSLTFVSRIFARPEQFPFSMPRRCEQRLRARVEMEIAPQIDNEEPVTVLGAKETQYESFRTEHCALNSIGALRAKHRVFAAQLQQILV